MKIADLENAPVLVTGDTKFACELAVCLQKGGHEVALKSSDRKKSEALVAGYYRELNYRERTGFSDSGSHTQKIKIIDEWRRVRPVQLAFIVNEECLDKKRQMLHHLEAILPADAIVAVNTESIELSDIQKGSRYPERIVGMNWVSPVYDTLFLEMIGNTVTDAALLEVLSGLAGDRWGKDPHVVKGETGIRMPLMAALIREAFFLVENGYASTEDIDRACRNDAGYYLPFAGNLRYMDLMGTYAYGRVMKELNSELSVDTQLPERFLNLARKGATGMEAGEGFYTYQQGEAGKWDQLLRKFSYEIKELFDLYPFETSAMEEPAYSPNKPTT